MNDSISHWSGSDDALPSTRISALSVSLLPTERKMTQAILSDPGKVVESTAQEIADEIGISRSSVIRCCQRLGYKGYPQLRVAVARQIAARDATTSEKRQPSTTSADADVLGFMRSKLEVISSTLPYLLGAITEEVAQQAVHQFEQAERILVVGNGLSSSLANDFSLRLTSIGYHAEYVADGIGQQVTAHQLGPRGVCMVVSGSGDTRTSISAATAARKSGATTIALTSFPSSPLASVSDIVLVATSMGLSFQTELSETSRISHMIVLELLVDVLRTRASTPIPREQLMEAIAENLDD